MLFMHHSELDIFRDGVQDGSQQVLQTRGSSALPVGMSDGFETDQMPYLIEQHFTNSRI